MTALTGQPNTDTPRVVVLGGGNGTSRLLQSLLPLLQAEKLESLHALVSTSDDGGSTGRLREQYAVGSMGDLTKCLVALSELRGDIRGEELLRALDYRFAAGDFQGHTLRNILLTVFELTAGDIDGAIAIMARLLQIPKQAGVVPLTSTPLTQQVVVTVDGEEKVLGEGQHFISHNVNLQIDPQWQPGDVRVAFAERTTEINPRAAELLQKATHIIVAPGHTFGTILPALAVPSLQQFVARSQASIWVIMTLLTTPRQTTGWTGEDFVRVYESYLGRSVDVVVANTQKAELALVEGQEWVSFVDESHPYHLLADGMVSTEQPTKQVGDVVPRAIAVHDYQRLRELFQAEL